MSQLEKLFEPREQSFTEFSHQCEFKNNYVITPSGEEIFANSRGKLVSKLKNHFESLRQERIVSQFLGDVRTFTSNLSPGEEVTISL